MKNGKGVMVRTSGDGSNNLTLPIDWATLFCKTAPAMEFAVNRFDPEDDDSCPSEAGVFLFGDDE